MRRKDRRERNILSGVIEYCQVVKDRPYFVGAEIAGGFYCGCGYAHVFQHADENIAVGHVAEKYDDIP